MASANEMADQRCLLRLLARRAPGGPPKAEPGHWRRAAAERSGAALIQYGVIRQCSGHRGIAASEQSAFRFSG